MRYALRSLKNDWRFSLNIILSLGLGLGVGLPALALSDHLFLRPPPGIAEPDRVMRLVKRQVSERGVFLTPSMTALDFDLARGMRSLDGAAAYFERPVALGRGGTATRLRATLVSAEFFDVLGARPFIGRTFTEAEDVVGNAAPPALVGYRYWQRAMHGDPRAIGERLAIGPIDYTVIGVMPEGFNGVALDESHVYLPIHVAAAATQDTDGLLWTTDRSSWIRVVARLRDGLSPDVAAAEATTAYRAPGVYSRDRERDDSLFFESIIPGRAANPSPAGRLSLWLTAGALLLNALIAANLVNLFVARAAARARPTAIRMALGGGLRHLLRTQIAETLLLGLAGSALGLIIAAQASGIVRATVVPSTEWTRPLFDLRLVGIAMLMVTITGGLASIASLLHLRRTDPGELLRGSGSQRAGVGRSARTVRTAMLVVQAGVFAVLLSLSAAFVLSVRRALENDHGFDLERLVFAEPPVREPGIDPARHEAIYAATAEAVRALPGVAAVSQAFMVPWWNSANRVISIPGGRDSMPEAMFDVASPEHLETTGMQMRAGRWIEPSDRAGTEPVIVVNETFARRAWAPGAAIGACVRVGSDTMPCRTVVGIVRDARMIGEPHSEIRPGYWVPAAQPIERPPHRALFIRLTETGAATPEMIAEAIRRAEPDLLPTTVTPVKQNLNWLTGRLETGRFVFTVFGALAGVVALVGLTGVLGYLVDQERSGIAVRVALGAEPVRVVRPIVLRALFVVAGGMVAGIVPLLLLRGMLDDMLYRTSVVDPLAFGAVVTIGLAMAAVAVTLPVRAILRIEPMRVLREE